MNNSNESTSRFKLPSKKKIFLTISTFSKQEWWTFIALLLVFIISVLGILAKINNSFKVEIPMSGGTISEGIIDVPRFMNPVLSTSEADRDVVALVYSGLVRKNQNGEIITDLADSYEVSPDGLTYTFTLRDDLKFHDGEKLTSKDVLYTIKAIQDPIIKSPRKGNWDGVEVDTPDDKTIIFTLRQPYASFLENATVGIMPAHIWSDSPLELNEANTKPIGSGPFKIKKVHKQESGVIDNVEFVRFKNFTLGKPYIKKLNLNFYKNEEDAISALNNGSIDQLSSLSPENLSSVKRKNIKIESAVLPRVFGLFFNQNQNQIFTNKTVVKAINQVIDKNLIVEQVLGGYGVAIDNPLPHKTISYDSLSNANSSSRDEIITQAKESLTKDGWTIGPSGYLEKITVGTDKKKVNTVLAFSISTGNAPELVKTAEIIQSSLAPLGIKVDIKTFESGNLNQSVIRPRDYDALLFGQIINNETDLYAFWHSSQRKDPGLNVAMYTNAKVDKALEDAFVTIDKNERVKKYSVFEDEIKKDMPAIFLYSPKFIYIVSNHLSGNSIDNVVSPRERFLDAYLWYLKTDKVWKIFAK